MNPDIVRVEVRLHDPVSGRSKEVWLDVNRHEFREALTPLPRDRELPWASEERARAAAQRAARIKAADLLAGLIAPALIKAIEKDDTINGYSREELERMGAPCEDTLASDPAAPFSARRLSETKTKR